MYGIGEENFEFVGIGIWWGVFELVMRKVYERDGVFCFFYF